MITRRLARPLGALSSSIWTCSSCTRASLLQKSPPLQPQRRRLHFVPQLGTYDATFKRDGVPGLFSPTGYSIAWTTYQEIMVDKLNELVAGEPIENMKPKDLAIQYARDPMNASLFNHASMAHNNHYFFSGLSTAPQRLDKIPTLKKSLESSFGSIESLRITMLDIASAMFGPGFVWLVWARDTSPSATATVTRSGSWRILATYLAGTPYPEAGYRAQGLDMNTNNSASFSDYATRTPANYAGSFGAFSQSARDNARIPPGGTRIMPILCVNTWEHVYIYDFGLAGKRKFLSDWWDCVDWAVAEANTPPEAIKQHATA